jgi:hypothetical protein
VEANTPAPRQAQDRPRDNLFGWADWPAEKSKFYPDAPGFKDWGTSRDAALAIACQAKTLRAAVLNCLLDAAPGALSADQIAIRLRRSPFSLRPRVSELARAGLIEPGPTRVVNDSGMSARTWRAAA